MSWSNNSLGVKLKEERRVEKLLNEPGHPSKMTVLFSEKTNLVTQSHFSIRLYELLIEIQANII